MSTRPRSAFTRLLGYARPYLGVILLALVFAGVFAGARSLRMYLLKPLLDEVALPAMGAEMPQEADSGLLSLPLPDVLTDRIPALTRESETSPAQDDAREEAARDALRAASEERFASIILLGLGLVLVLPLAGFGKDYLVEYTVGKTLIDIQRSLAAKLLLLPLQFHNRAARGDILSRSMNDVQYAQNGLRLLFGDVAQGALSLLVGVAVLLHISWQLSLVALGVAPVLLGVVGWFGRRVRHSAKARQEKMGDVTQRLVEILAGIKVIKAFRAEASEEEAFGRENRQLFRRNMRVVRNRVTSRSLIEGMNNAVGIGILVLGAGLVLRGQWGLSIGDLTAFIGVMFTTYRHPKTLAKGWNQLMDALPAAERFFHLLDEPVGIDDAPDAVRIDGIREGIRFEKVRFSYGREPVLQDFDLTLPAGKVTAVVGRTGAGKTTVADLLLRFHDPEDGRVTLDGVDLRQVERDSLLDQIAVVSQSPFLFRGSIRDNILYGRPDARDDEVLAAARAAHVDEFATQLPDGYDTEVGQEGVQLSGGQRQRITIARALLKNPALLVFDEATSSLDAKSERFVQKAIESLLAGRTVLLIAHRLSTIREAHRIAVIDAGQVVQLGDHAELMRQPGLYRELLGVQEESA